MHEERPAPLFAIGLALLGGVAVGALIARHDRDQDDDESNSNEGFLGRPGKLHEIVVCSTNGILSVSPDVVEVYGPGFIVWTIDSSLPGYSFPEGTSNPAIVFERNRGDFTPPERVSASDREVFVRDTYASRGKFKYTVNLIDAQGRAHCIDPHVKNLP